MKGLKYAGTKSDIVNDFYTNIQRCKDKYAAYKEAIEALEEIEDISIWWANAPTLKKP